MRLLTVLLVLFCSGCASYRPPGAAVRLAELDGADAAAIAARQPSPHFPVRLALARAQAADYVSATRRAVGQGRFGVLAEPELLDDAARQAIEAWPALAAVQRIDVALLPEQLDGLDALRLAAAKQRADVLLVWSVDTRFQQDGKDLPATASFQPKAVQPGTLTIAVTVSGVFVDVRSGFIYGGTDASLSRPLAEAVPTAMALDARRLAAERAAFASFIDTAARTWAGIVARYP